MTSSEQTWGIFGESIFEHYRVRVSRRHQVAWSWGNRVKEVISNVKVGESSGLYPCFGKNGMLEMSPTGVRLSTYAKALASKTTHVGTKTISRLLKGSTLLNPIPRLEEWLADKHVASWLMCAYIDYDPDNPESNRYIDTMMLTRHLKAEEFNMNAMDVVIRPYDEVILGQAQYRAESCPACSGVLTSIVREEQKFIMTKYDVGCKVPFINSSPIKGIFEISNSFSGSAWVKNNIIAHHLSSPIDPIASHIQKIIGDAYVICYHTPMAFSHIHLHVYTNERVYQLNGKPISPFEMTVMASLLNVVCALNKRQGSWSHSSIFADLPLPIKGSYMQMSQDWKPFLILFMHIICYACYPTVDIYDRARAWLDLTREVENYKLSEAYAFLTYCAFKNWVPASMYVYDNIPTGDGRCLNGKCSLMLDLTDNSDEWFVPPIEKIKTILYAQEN